MYDPTKPATSVILKLIRSTWTTPHVRVTDGVYPVIEKRFRLPEVHHTDGIGTKGEYHWRARTFVAAALDALAMNLNDLAMAGAQAYALQNHIVLPQDDRAAILAILETLATECRQRGIAMTGGETSIHEGSPGLDVSLTVAGFVERLRRNEYRPGDVLLGLRSSGLHANGFTKVRELFGDAVQPAFTEPTAIYYDAILPLLAEVEVRAMQHITGGAFTKFKPHLRGVDLRFDGLRQVPMPEIFRQLYERGASDADMYRTFNCGVGFVLAVPESSVPKITKRLNATVIGRVEQGSGRVIIDSAFRETTVTF